MYTGIIKEVGVLADIAQRKGVDGIRVRTTREFLRGLEIGGSIALNGICLSVTRLYEDGFGADVTNATAKATTFQFLNPQDSVNLERSASHGQEIGGHLTAGHVDGMAIVTSVEWLGEAMRLGVKVAPELVQYVFAKGFLALDGASLTVSNVVLDAGELGFNLTPETLRQTTFSNIAVGDVLNVEVEPTTRVLVDTMLRSQR
ncbi:riboflavin synthase subunit alpha [Pseudomonas alabamensis]|uniref:riboflavin synthase subunit alpha n=1 Tax=Pseudomonas alabamensis TaxID=3064349 RepID=UPI003F651A27